MNPRTEQEILDLLQTGQITQSEAQMYRAQLKSNNPFGDIFATPDRQTAMNLGQNMFTIPNQFPVLNQQGVFSTSNSQGVPVQGNPTNIFGDIWSGNNNMPTNPYGQDVQYPVFNGSPNTKTTPIATPDIPAGRTLSLTDKPTREEWIQYSLENGLSSPDTAAQNWDDYMEANAGSGVQNKNSQRGFPMIFPGGSDLSTELYTLGRSIGAPKGSTGRTAGIVGSAGAALFDISRNIASGIGYENMNQYVDQWYREQQFGGANKNYVAAPQYQNNNYLGGFYGEDGGEAEMNQDPAQNPQVLQQIASQVTQALSQGQTPQAVVKTLVQQGMSQQQAQQLVSAVIQNMQQAGGQGQPNLENQENATNLVASEAAPVMKNGGLFKHKVGDSISFSHGGKKVSGVISKIEGGKIYL